MAGVVKRAELAGDGMGKAIIEMVNLMYQNNTALSFLRGTILTLQTEVEKRELTKDGATSITV